MKINPLIFRIGLGIGVLLLAIGAPLLERDEHCIVLFSKYKIRERSSAYHQLWAILQRLCQMRRLYLFTSRQVCNGAGEFQDAMISACR